MRLISYLHDGASAWGAADEDLIFPARASFPSLRAALTLLGPDRIGEALAYDADPLNRSDLPLLPPVLDPGKILCIGLNYADHIAEMGRARSEHPVVFTRYPDSLVGHTAPLVAPAASEQFDYEGELAIVIGRAGRRISTTDALNYVFGYSVFNDGSVRDYQRHTHQFTPGKNFPRSGSFGPELVTRDEIDDLDRLTISTTLNERVVQQSTLAQLAFGVAEIIAYVSQWTMIEPGDVIATGTPGGVGDGREPKLWMRPGDRCSISIDRIGTLTNPIVAEDPAA